MISYLYRATFVRDIDGDTVILDLDLGFYLSFRARIRLVRVNAPELTSPDPGIRAKAVAAANYVATQLASASELTVASTKTDDYGRWLGDIRYKAHDGNWYNLSDQLLNLGFAVPWPMPTAHATPLI